MYREGQIIRLMIDELLQEVERLLFLQDALCNALLVLAQERVHRGRRGGVHHRVNRFERHVDGAQ